MSEMGDLKFTTAGEYLEDQETYSWHRIHKAEANIEDQITEWVFDHVLEHFGVEEVTDLTDSQIAEIDHFRNEVLNEYSVMQAGYSNLINFWESENTEL